MQSFGFGGISLAKSNSNLLRLIGSSFNPGDFQHSMAVLHPKSSYFGNCNSITIPCLMNIAIDYLTNARCFKFLHWINQVNGLCLLIWCNCFFGSSFPISSLSFFCWFNYFFISLNVRVLVQIRQSTWCHRPSDAMVVNFGAVAS